MVALKKFKDVARLIYLADTQKVYLTPGAYRKTAKYLKVLANSLTTEALATLDNEEPEIANAFDYLGVSLRDTGQSTETSALYARLGCKIKAVTL